MGTVAQGALTAVQQVAAKQALRAKRLNAVASALVAQRKAAKQQAYLQATNAYKQVAYLKAAQALAAQYGVALPTISARATNQSAVVQSAPQSAVQGACKLVRAYVHQNSALTVKQVQAHFSLGTAEYINPHTVATQYQRAKHGVA